MYQWFNRATGVSDAKKEPEIVQEEEKTLWCSPQGQVAGMQSKPIYSFTRELSREMARKRVRLDGPALRQAVTHVLRIPRREGDPAYRILRARGERGHPQPYFNTYLVETSPGVQAFVYRLSPERLFSRPPKTQRAVLYVSHLSADEELRSEPLIKELLGAEAGAAFFTCDVRGIGESQPDTCNPNTFHSPYGSDYFYSAHSIMLDMPYLGQRTYDVLRTLDWLAATGHTEVHLAGKGWGAIPAAFAALLSHGVVQVTLKNALTSYTEVAEAKDYNWPLALLPPDLLDSFDLPEVYGELETKGLRLVEPWGADPKEV
jgi:hypothetical protein